MRVRLTPAALLSAALAAAAAPPLPAAPPAAPAPDPAAVAAGVDKLIAAELADKPVKVADPVDDLGYLRRVSIDLTGRIPTAAEIDRFLSWPAGERRAKLAQELMSRDQLADRWAVFFGDLLRVRSQADGGAALQAFVHEALRANMPWDELTRRLISASGKAGAQPETGFVLNDEGDPMALTGVVSQVFLGTRVSCAECHDHPFDKWTREDFYDLAAFFGKTRKVEQRVRMNLVGVFVQEAKDTKILWPPEDKAKGKPRAAVAPKFPFPLDEGDGPTKHIARLKALRTAKAAEQKAQADAKKESVDSLLDDAGSTAKKPADFDVTAEAKKAARELDVLGALTQASELRKALADQITDPRNRAFSRAMVNRVWAELVGRGFVNPVDDFRDDNPPVHPKALDFLADEFVASGYDFRFLVRAVVGTAAYQRGKYAGTVPPPELLEAEKLFAVAPARRMVSEAMFDSIVQAGHLFDVKHPPGENLVTVVTYERVKVGVKEDPLKPAAKPLAGGGGPGMGGMAGMSAQMAGGGYDLERGIEVDFKAALKKKDAIELDAMKATPDEILEAEMMAKRGMLPPGQRAKYATREVRTQVDDNPRFTSSMRMASPAPTGHFLRVFGQTDRGTLDEKRDHSPSMRQALMMLNGKLTNEAARVGPLEPVAKFILGPTPDVDAAVKMVYREILTRAPSADELAEATAIVKGGDTPADGLADLRWALFNCNEFRFLP